MTPRIMAVGEEPPPMDALDAGPSKRPHRDKPKGKPDGAKAKAGERFAVLNAFVDFAVANLSRAEIAVWLVLFRDTRDGTAQDLLRRPRPPRRLQSSQRRASHSAPGAARLAQDRSSRRTTARRRRATASALNRKSG